MPSELNGAMTLSLMTANVRNDLMDTGSPQRWPDGILQREIDRALARYSQVSPRLERVQVQTTAGSRVYAVPANAWWIDLVEYPIGQWPKVYQTFAHKITPFLLPPSVAPVVGAGGGGTLSGAYLWAVTFMVPGGGETTPSPMAALTVPNGSVGVLSNVPADGSNYASARNIYRTLAGGNQLKYAGQIADNLTTTFTDGVADGSLGANAPASNGTAGYRVVELDLRPEFLPPDNQQVLEVTYSQKHELDVSGTTVPEKHWDAIEVGAEAYALYAYLATANDNFDWVDGQFRDRVDDSKAPIAWKAQADAFMGQFEERLRAIKLEAETTITPLAQWGDKPYRWDRL